MSTQRRKKLSRKEIMRRRKRERRIYLLTAAFATLCVFAIVGLVLALQQNSDRRDEGTWIVEGEVEIAAPGQQNAGGAVIIEPTGLPEFPPAATATPEPFVFITETPEPTAEPVVEMPALEGEIQRSMITITAAGDFTLGGDHNSSGHQRFDGYADEYGYDYFLENVRHIFEADDLTFVNLEGPLTVSEDRRGGRIFNFKGDPEYVQILSGSSVELAGLANNHSLDFGMDGLLETADVLDGAGVGYCGYEAVWRETVNGIDVTCLSVTEWDYTTDELANMLATERGSCDLLVVMIHWGEEKVYEATDSQVEYGHALIDAGADLVLGSHSHVVGGVELYNGKYIVYGLGNFCFGGNKNPSDKDCLIFQQTFELQPDGTLVDAGISVIPCASSSRTDTNDYRPTPYTGAEAARVLRKIGRYSTLDGDQVIWSTTMDEYLALMN